MSTASTVNNEADSPEPPPLPSRTIPRRHDLDALRAAAMLAGIFLHGSLAYVTFEFWPVHDAHTSQVFDVANAFIHGFRMPLFFMISGFFTAMLWRKRGLRALLKHRAKRILLPMVLFMVTVLPAMGGVIWFHYASGRHVVEVEAVAEKKSDTLWQAAKDNDLEALAAMPVDTDWDARDPEHGIPALNWAAFTNSPEAAAWLLEQGADPNVVSKDNSTPALHAAFMGRSEVLQLFIDRGADLNVVNDHRSTALDALGADMGIVKWVGDAIGFEFDAETVRRGREQCRSLLTENGGLQVHQLHDQRGGENAESATFASGYLAMTALPVFREPGVLAHLWFLWHLCLLLAPFIVYAIVADRLRVPRWLIRTPAVLLWLIPLTMAAQWLHGLEQPTFGPDTSSTFIPKPHVLLLYGVYFLFGAVYFDSDDKDSRVTRGWWAMLLVAAAVVFPLGLMAIFAPQDLGLDGDSETRFSVVAAQATFAWLMIFGLIGLCRKICSRESRTVRYVSDSAYWLYVGHLPLVFLAQSLVAPLQLPIFAKFAIVCVSVTAVLLVTYDRFVRYTWLGTLLNGKRSRCCSPNDTMA